MAAWEKVSADLAAMFLAALPDDPRVEPRKMFGCPCAFVNGNMFAGLHEARLIVRIPEEAPQRPCVMMGRTMKEYAAFDKAIDLGAKAMKQWIARGFAHASTLPPKLKATRTRPKLSGR